VAHFRRQIAAALVLNTAISAVEVSAGTASHSMSLLTDSVHNCSDELALVCLYAAFFLPGYLGQHSQRLANGLNSLGLIALSMVMIWESIHRLAHPTPVLAVIPILAGIAAALGNYGVVRLLRAPAAENACARLAYVHNRGDVAVSLAPVIAGVGVALSGRTQVDVLIAVALAVWLIVTTLHGVRTSMDELLWPEQITCGHFPPVPTASSASSASS
jgi:Co/Zn/Cd efflux system component